MDFIVYGSIIAGLVAIVAWGWEQDARDGVLPRVGDAMDAMRNWWVSK